MLTITILANNIIYGNLYYVNLFQNTHLTAYGETPVDGSSYLEKPQKFTVNEDGLLGKVLTGNATKPICVPGNSALTILGRLGKNTKVPSVTPCLIDTTAINNLPQGISVNHCLVHHKGSVVPVIVMNQKI